MTEPHICEYTHDCLTLDELLPRVYEAPTLTLGYHHHHVLPIILISSFEQVIERLDMLGLDESVMVALHDAREVIESEIMCQHDEHNEIFQQFLKDGMKFLPALQAVHRV